MNRTASLLALVPVAFVVGCSSSSGSAGTPAGPATSATPTVSLVAEVKTLTAKLGCATALVIAGAGYADGAETAECRDPYRGIFVFADQAALDAWLKEARGVGGFYATGPTWAVHVSTTEDLADVVKRTGGSTTPATPSAASTSPTSLTHLEDAKLLGCAADSGNAAAQVRITNTATVASDFAVDVAFSSADGSRRLATGSVVVGGLQPGESADDVANGLIPAPAGGYVCRIIDVTRVASP